MCCNGQHECDNLQRGEEISLFKLIDHDKIVALNESKVGSCRHIFKSTCEKLSTETFCETTADDSDLIITLKFTSAVKLKSFIVVGGENGTAPSKLKLYINKDNLDFSSVRDTPATQEFELNYDPTGMLDVPTKYSRFQNVHTLTLFFNANHGADTTKIYYMQLNGENLNARHGIVIATYEVKPNVSENKSMADQKAHNNVV